MRIVCRGMIREGGRGGEERDGQREECVGNGEGEGRGRRRKGLVNENSV